MLTNIDSSQMDEHLSELHIFYNDDLFSNHWHPIKSGNPVIFDQSKERNGGFFVHDSKLYRVNQSHGFSRYGVSFCINEINDISKDKYIENPVSSVNPNFSKNIFLSHHFSADSRFAAVEFARLQRFKRSLNSWSLLLFLINN